MPASSAAIEAAITPSIFLSLPRGFRKPPALADETRRGRQYVLGQLRVIGMAKLPRRDQLGEVHRRSAELRGLLRVADELRVGDLALEALEELLPAGHLVEGKGTAGIALGVLVAGGDHVLDVNRGPVAGRLQDHRVIEQDQALGRAPARDERGAVPGVGEIAADHDALGPGPGSAGRDRRTRSTPSG